MTQLALNKNAGVRRSTLSVVLKALLYVVLIALALFTLIPFVWMISASLKLDREVFSYPIRWIPEVFHWENYSLIWQKVPLLTYFKNTASIALLVTYIYDEAFSNFNYGVASAIAMVLLVIVLIFTLVQFSMEDKYANN